MASRLPYADTAFVQSHGRKRPRLHKEDHLSFVRQLPCLVCGVNAPNEAAHVRYGSLRHGKRSTGLGEKPSDQWAVPLCAKDHREGPDAQHLSNEEHWWKLRGIDPLVVAALLYANSGDVEAGTMIIRDWQLTVGS